MAPEDILAHLAERELYGLPVTSDWTDTDGPSVAVRMHCFANSTQWLLVGENLYYDMDEWGGPDAFSRCLWAYGTSARRFHHVFETIVSDGDVPLFIPETDDIDDQITCVSIRGIDVDIAGLPTPGMNGAGFYRALCEAPSMRERLMSTSVEVREALGIGDLTCLLTLDDWAAPTDPSAYARSEVLRLLAQVMAHQDPTLYQPTERPNMSGHASHG